MFAAGESERDGQRERQRIEQFHGLHIFRLADQFG
jgi:hypothetical protein